MKIMIKYKLFLAMLAASGAVVIAMFLIMQWSIGHGFLSYVNTVEQDRLTKLADALEDAYDARGSWAFLEADPKLWPKMLASTSPREGDAERAARAERALSAAPPTARPEAPSWPPPAPKGPPPEANPAAGPPTPVAPPPPQASPPAPSAPAGPHGFAGNTSQRQPPWYAHRFEMRVFLLDASKHQIAGPPGQLKSQVDLKKIVSNRHVVGYLGIRPRQRITDRHQLMFVKQQKLAMGLVAVTMLLISAAISLPLANRLVLPIRRLAGSMHRLAAGNFETRAAVGPEDELGQLARDFNTLALSLEKNEETRRRWVADISHELRTPLAILRGEIEAVQDGVRQPNAESMRSLHAEVMHLTRLVDDLYQISLTDIGALTYRKDVLDLRALLAQEVDSFQGEFAQKGIKLSGDLGKKGDFAVFADANRLQQLFDNLLDNSLKYTDGGGELVVRLKAGPNGGVVEFEDTGPGVPQEELAKLFDRLYRVDNSRNRARGGAGLGLAICKNIVEAHEGSISALPSPKGGVLIRIELPLTGSRL